eukprot:jgi/Botrbrau1/23329/Bobra.0102s0063.1
MDFVHCYLDKDELRLACGLIPQRNWEGELKRQSPLIAKVTETCWRHGDQPTALISHILCGGPCFTLFFNGPRGSGPQDAGYRAWAQWHGECSKAKGCIVAEYYNQACQFCLVPILWEGEQLGGRNDDMVFLGYIIGRGTGQVLGHVLQTARMPLIFDLDETLLVASSSSQLEQKMDEASRRRKAEKALLENCSAEERNAHLAKVQVLEKEEVRLREDFDLLRQYVENNCIALNRKVLQPVFEKVHPDDDVKGLGFERPVIRMPDGAPASSPASTPTAERRPWSFRIRPGWDELRKYLEEKPRFEIHVCTTAEKQYAMEAWRQLDPAGILIPRAARKTRIVVGQRQGCRHEEGAGSRPRGGAAPVPARSMPLAIILDDRTEVWDEQDQAQILKVQPYMPHDGSLQDLSMVIYDDSAQKMLAAEMRKVKDKLVFLRQTVYYNINEVFRPQLAEALEGPTNPQVLAQEAQLPPLVPQILAGETSRPWRCWPLARGLRPRWEACFNPLASGFPDLRTQATARSPLKPMIAHGRSLPGGGQPSSRRPGAGPTQRWEAGLPCRPGVPSLDRTQAGPAAAACSGNASGPPPPTPEAFRRGTPPAPPWARWWGACAGPRERRTVGAATP